MPRTTKTEKAFAQAVRAAIQYSPSNKLDLDSRLSFMSGYLERDYPGFAKLIRQLRDGEVPAHIVRK